MRPVRASVVGLAVYPPPAPPTPEKFAGSIRPCRSCPRGEALGVEHAVALDEARGGEGAGDLVVLGCLVDDVLEIAQVGLVNDRAAHVRVPGVAADAALNADRGEAEGDHEGEDAVGEVLVDAGDGAPWRRSIISVPPKMMAPVAIRLGLVSFGAGASCARWLRWHPVRRQSFCATTCSTDEWTPQGRSHGSRVVPRTGPPDGEHATSTSSTAEHLRAARRRRPRRRGLDRAGLVDAHCHLGLDDFGATDDAATERQASTTATGERCSSATPARPPTPAGSTTATTCRG